MIVFLDTTELRQNPNLHGVKWEKLARFLLQAANVGIVTDLVREEMVNHVREDLIRIRHTLVKCVDDLCHITGKPSSFEPQFDVDSHFSEYRDRFNARLEQLHFSNRAYIGVSIENLVARALERRKPFDGGGQKGFRDAVQWEIILATVRETADQIIFVTANKKDFGEHQSLAADLEADLLKIGHSGAVKICEGLDLFIREYVEPTLERPDDEIALAIAEGEYQSFHTDDFICGLWKEIETAVKDEVEANGLNGLDPFIGRHFSDPILSSLSDEASVIEADVFRMDDEVLAASITIEIAGEITCEEDLSGNPREPPDYREFTGDATFTIRIGAVIKEYSGDVLEQSVDSVKINLGYAWPYSDDD